MAQPPEDLSEVGIPAPVTEAGAAPLGGLRDYLAWHDAYDDAGSSLTKRLRQVRAEIDRFLDDTAPRPVRVLSLCAGDGRDLLGVLADRPDRRRVTGTLVEILPALVARARRRVTELGLDDALEVRQADAGHSDTYAGAVPADLVIVAGVMGNISAPDIHRLVRATREMAAPSATVLWTRGATAPDLGPQIRTWFDEAGFESVRLHQEIEGSPMRLGVERLVAEPEQLRPGRLLFTFLR